MFQQLSLPDDFIAAITMISLWNNKQWMGVVNQDKDHPHWNQLEEMDLNNHQLLQLYNEAKFHILSQTTNHEKKNHV